MGKRRNSIYLPLQCGKWSHISIAVHMFIQTVEFPVISAESPAERSLFAELSCLQCKLGFQNRSTITELRSTRKTQYFRFSKYFEMILKAVRRNWRKYIKFTLVWIRHNVTKPCFHRLSLTHALSGRYLASDLISSFRGQGEAHPINICSIFDTRPTENWHIEKYRTGSREEVSDCSCEDWSVLLQVILLIYPRLAK